MGEEDNGEKKGEVSSRNMYNGPMDEDNGDVGGLKVGDGWYGGSGEEKMEITVLEQ